MELELKTIGEQFLDHGFQLLDIRLAGRIGPALDVVLLRFEPVRSAGDLPDIHVIGELD